MIVTTYTCDKCSHAQEKSEQMWDIGILVREPNSTKYTSSYSQNPKSMQLWCRACVVKLGLLPSKKDDPPKPDPIPTFEEMIREIIQEEIEGSQA